MTPRLAGSTLGDSHGAVAAGHGHCNDEELVPWREPQLLGDVQSGRRPGEFRSWDPTIC